MKFNKVVTKLEKVRIKEINKLVSKGFTYTEAQEATEFYNIAMNAVCKEIEIPMFDDGAFGKCYACHYEFNSELISEYEMKYCIKCGQAFNPMEFEPKREVVK